MNFKSSSTRLSEDNYYEKQIDYTDKADFIGYLPLSIRIKQSELSGSLTEIMREYENSKITHPDIDYSLIPLSVSNIKNLDKVQLSSALQKRIEKYHDINNKFVEKLVEYKKLKAERNPQTLSESFGETADSNS